MNDAEMLFVKFGGSLITRKDEMFTVDYGRMRRIVRELAEVLDEISPRLIIGHGGGSFPHPIAKSFNVREGIEGGSKRGFVLCRNAASTLNRIFVDMMNDYGVDAISIQTSAAVMAKNGEIQKFFIDPIKSALSLDLIPVVYGDCVFDVSRGFTVVSTERIFKFLARHIRPSRVIIFSIVNGIYTSDPLKDKHARRIPRINANVFSDDYLRDSYYIDATGGMREKVKELFDIAKSGVECEILSGDEGNIKRALSGYRGIGTIIEAEASAGGDY